MDVSSMPLPSWLMPWVNGEAAFFAFIASAIVTLLWTYLIHGNKISSNNSSKSPYSSYPAAASSAGREASMSSFLHSALSKGAEIGSAMASTNTDAEWNGDAARFGGDADKLQNVPRRSGSGRHSPASSSSQWTAGGILHKGMDMCVAAAHANTDGEWNGDVHYRDGGEEEHIENKSLSRVSSGSTKRASKSPSMPRSQRPSFATHTAKVPVFADVSEEETKNNKKSSTLNNQPTYAYTAEQVRHHFSNCNSSSSADATPEELSKLFGTNEYQEWFGAREEELRMRVSLNERQHTWVALACTVANILAIFVLPFDRIASAGNASSFSSAPRTFSHLLFHLKYNSNDASSSHSKTNGGPLDAALQSIVSKLLGILFSLSSSSYQSVVDVSSFVSYLSYWLTVILLLTYLTSYFMDPHCPIAVATTLFTFIALVLLVPFRYMNVGIGMMVLYATVITRLTRASA